MTLREIIINYANSYELNILQCQLVFERTSKEEKIKLANDFSKINDKPVIYWFYEIIFRAYGPIVAARLYERSNPRTTKKIKRRKDRISKGC